MQVTPTKFDGLYVITPDVHTDHRGRFYETYQENRYVEAGISTHFVQDDVSCSNANVLRGLHGQAGQSKLVQVVLGEAFDVAVDIRPNSKTFKQYFSIILSEKTAQQVLIPEGFLHGSLILSDHALFHYKCSRAYNPKEEIGARYDDPAFAIKWPKINNLILNDKDKAYPLFER